MSVNSTSSDLSYRCSKSEETISIFIFLAVMKAVIILPLSIFILLLGFRHWRRQRSLKSASHADIFTYNLAAMEMSWGYGLVCYLAGLYTRTLWVTVLGICCFSFTFFAELFVHVLTCVERFLAVVHPVTYRDLRNARGVRIRRICISCVWLMSSTLMLLHVDTSGEKTVNAMLCFLVFCLIVTSFCSFSVLRALIRPGPGEGGRDDRSKRRAFQTIAVISAAMWLWFLMLFLSMTLSKSPLLSENAACVLTTSSGLFNLPSALVLPLLFLHRSGKRQTPTS